MAIKKLTDKQKTVFNYMIDFFIKNHQIPPIASIGKQFGIANNAAYLHVKALERQGVLERNDIGKYKFAKGHVTFVADIESLANYTNVNPSKSFFNTLSQR